MSEERINRTPGEWDWQQQQQQQPWDSPGYTFGNVDRGGPAETQARKLAQQYAQDNPNASDINFSAFNRNSNQQPPQQKQGGGGYPGIPERGSRAPEGNMQPQQNQWSVNGPAPEGTFSPGGSLNASAIPGRDAFHASDEYRNNQFAWNELNAGGEPTRNPFETYSGDYAQGPNGNPYGGRYRKWNGVVFDQGQL